MGRLSLVRISKNAFVKSIRDASSQEMHSDWNPGIPKCEQSIIQNHSRPRLHLGN